MDKMSASQPRDHGFNPHKAHEDRGSGLKSDLNKL